jgi:hypothetical protein
MEQNGYLDTIKNTMIKNEEFLKKESKEVFDELILFLSDDVIENVKFATKIKNPSNWAMWGFVIYIFQPLCHSLYVDLLAGNLPACFFEIRLLLEALAEHYLADVKYPPHLLFEQKLELLENDLKKTKTGISELMKELDKVLMIEGSSALWRDLSETWIHAKGLSKKIISYAVERQAFPLWTLVIPAYYTKEDLHIIKEFGKKLSTFKRISKNAVNSWKKFLMTTNRIIKFEKLTIKIKCEIKVISF